MARNINMLNTQKLDKTYSELFLSILMEKEITLNDISIHAKSKKEIYHVFTVEGGIYLPPILDADKIYIRNIIRGYKKL